MGQVNTSVRSPKRVAENVAEVPEPVYDHMMHWYNLGVICQDGWASEYGKVSTPSALYNTPAPHHRLNCSASSLYWK